MVDKVALEVCEMEFDRFIDEMALCDEAELRGEDLEAFLPLKARILKSMQAGSTMVNDKGEPVVQVGDESLTFHEPTGASLMQTGRKQNDDMARMYAAMGNMTKTSSGTFAKMRMRDLRVCVAITTLFLA